MLVAKLSLIIPLIMLGGCHRGARPAARARVLPVPLEGVTLEVAGLGVPGLPRIDVHAGVLRGDTLATETLSLEEDYYLEFLPLLMERRVEGVEFEVLARSDKEEFPLARVSPFPTRSDGLGTRELLRFLASPARVDLSRFTGKEIVVRWQLVGSEVELGGAVGNPRLRPARLDYRLPNGTRTPDILMMCSDAHRYDYYRPSPHGNPMPGLHLSMPEAVDCRQAYSNASWTMPAIASAMTGLSPRYHRAGMRTTRVRTEDFRPAEVPRGEFAFLLGNHYQLMTAYAGQLATFSETLREMGYATVLAAANPLYSLSGLAHDGQEVAIDPGVARGPVMNQLAAEVLESFSPDRPLFLLVHYMDVHHWEPWYFSEEYAGLDKTGAPDEIRASYARAVRDTDEYVSALVEQWKERRDYDRSVVIFFSDHGEHLLDPGRPRLVGHGNSMDELLLKIPLLIKFPEGTRIPECVTDENVSLVDLAPTLLELAGAEDVVLHDEESLLWGESLLDLPGRSSLPPRVIHADCQLYGAEMSSARQGAFKLLMNWESGECSLIRIAPHIEDGLAPPSEVDDLEMERALLAAHREYEERSAVFSAGLDYDREIDQEDALERLRALGYVR